MITSKQKTATSAPVVTRVAIVEDNAMFRRFLVDLINGTAGCRCVAACGSAEEGLARIPEQHPEVVLMDIHLPGDSGIVCTARLRDLVPKTQVLMLTVYRDIKMIFQALKAGACGYLLKRSDGQEILDAIAEVRAGGAPMTSEIARLVVRSFQTPLAEPQQTAALSPREQEILALLADGLSNKEIAAKLFISFFTVRAHLMHIYEKLHVRSRTEAAAKFLRAGQEPPPGAPSLLRRAEEI